MSKRKHQPEPWKNDIVYSCANNISVSAILEALNASDLPATEFSSQGWNSWKKVSSTILHAYGYPKEYQKYYDQQNPNLEALEDLLFKKSYDQQSKKYIGEILIVRHCQPEVARYLALFVQAALGRVMLVKPYPHINPDIRFIVVFSGWAESTITVHRKLVVVVNPLGETP